MQIDPQEYLKLVESNNELVFFDIESTGLRGDYNSVLVVSCLPYQDTLPTTFLVQQPGNDQKVVRQAKEFLEDMMCWVGFYSKGFDVPMLNTRLLKWRHDPILKRHHIDLYFTLKHNLLTARRSQAHLLRWLDTSEKKMDVGADEWNRVLDSNTQTKAMKIMRNRCESDVIGLRDLYNKTKHLIADIKRG